MTLTASGSSRSPRASGPRWRALPDAGLTRLGENRVQEALPKIEALPGAEWHLVGRLQRNKARKAVAAFALIHSVDSVELLRRLSDGGGEHGLAPACCCRST